MTEPSELSRPVDVRQSDGKVMRIEADAAERAALAARFDLVRIDRLAADLVLARKDRVVEASGTLRAAWVQPCAISAEDLAITIEEPLSFRFVPASAAHVPDEEVEIDAEDCDEIEYSGLLFDVGEAVAQSLGLAIDPYATGPEAEAARERLGADEANPFAVLKTLKTSE